jgi:glycosyltransferase involved in cell wall biosynthesis
MKPSPLRVLRIIDRLNVGGPALQATVLSEGLDPAHFDQRLLAGAIDPDEGDYVSLRAPDLPVERIAGLGRAPHLGNDAEALWHISRAIRDFRPHIVHTHKAKAGVLGRVAAWTHRCPATVHHFHGHLLSGYFSPSKTKVVAGIERALARPTTALVAVGAQVRDELLAAGIGRREQYSIVPPGVLLPAAPDRRTAREALGLPVDAPVICFVGRLTQVKRPERFVDMAIAVSRRHPTAEFLIAGKGELLDSLRDRARPLEGRCRFLGWRGDVATVYAASDLVVLTSDNEGMPVSLIEAASVGTPAVTTRVGSAPEVVLDGVTGFVTTTDVEALAHATVDLLENDELRARMGVAAALRAQRDFSAARLVADIGGLYERIAAERRLG